MSFSDNDSTDHDFLMEAFADVDSYLGGLNTSNSFTNLENQCTQQQQPEISLYAYQSLQHGVDNDYMPLSMFAGVAVPFPDQSLYNSQQNKQQMGLSHQQNDTKKFQPNMVEAPKRTLTQMDSKAQRPKKQKIGNEISGDSIETRKEHLSSKTLHAAAAKEKRRYDIFNDFFVYCLLLYTSIFSSPITYTFHLLYTPYILIIATICTHPYPIKFL
jgi:hypothetical protein